MFWGRVKRAESRDRRVVDVLLRSSNTLDVQICLAPLLESVSIVWCSMKWADDWIFSFSMLHPFRDCDIVKH